MKNDPTELASRLVREHGLEGAIDVATEAITSSHQHQDYYSLSVWREIRRLLRDRKQLDS